MGTLASETDVSASMSLAPDVSVAADPTSPTTAAATTLKYKLEKVAIVQQQGEGWVYMKDSQG